MSQFNWLKYAISLTLFPALMVGVVNCTETKLSSGVVADSEKEIEVLKPSMEKKNLESYTEDKVEWVIKIPNSDNLYDVFAFKEDEKTGSRGDGMERIQFTYLATQNSEAKAIRKKVVEPELSVYFTKYSKTLIAYYYQKPSEDSGVDSAGLANANMGEMFVFREGYTKDEDPEIGTTDFGYHLTIDDRNIEKLAKETGASILDTRAEVHSFYVSPNYEYDKYDFIFDEWAVIQGIAKPKLKEKAE